MKIKQGLLLLGIAGYTLLSVACQPKGQSSKQDAVDTAKLYEQMITGRWQQQEINGGVICSVFFMPKGRLTVFFQTAEGYTRIRPGEWHIEGDTLHIMEQTGPTAMFIERVNDSLMILRSQDSVPVAFERRPQAKQP